ncbi:MAG: glycoside hydrolase family 127 protein [Prevotellaceae bacterium]|jgi:DUF1680 family protein|nr:glycoside hydrolase family 127 protein [Prevotellaceae bacterium]
MTGKILLSIVLLALLHTGAFCREASAKVEDRQYPLPPGAVRLSGFLENDIQNSIEHWNRGVLPYADFVDFFRNGRSLLALGEIWGKAVRSGCMFYRYTHDPELKRRLEATVKDMMTTQQSNGSISCVRIDQQPDSRGGDLWERKYVMLGMEEYYEWVHPDPEVLESLKKQADCIIEQIGNPPKTPITEQGWSATGIESSTLLEPFVRLYRITGEQRYLNFATYIIEAGGAKGSDLFQQAYDNVEPRNMGLPYPKAYEMTSLFEGAAEYYRITGDQRIKQSILNYFKNIKEKEITIIGNGGGRTGGEEWNSMASEQSNPDITRMMETCIGVTWIKFCSQILRLTSDASSVDKIEKYIYNGLLGAMKPTGDGFSYVNLLNGKKMNDPGWGWHFDDGHDGKLHVTCCNLNGPMGLAYIPYIAVTGSKEGPVINLYNAATVDMTSPAGQNPLKLAIETDYPQSDKVLIKVSPDHPETFTLKLRIPSWSENTSVKVNGKKQTVTAGAYADITRQWKPGDRVEIVFDMKCRVLDSPHGTNRNGDNMQAVTWGPIVLARDENTDRDYNQPVTVKADKTGLVKAVKTKPTLEGTRMEFIIPTTKGTIRMVDYASVNGWSGSQVCTWLHRD